MLNKHQELINESSRNEITNAAIGLFGADREAAKIIAKTIFLNGKNQNNPQARERDVSKIPQLFKGSTDVIGEIASFFGNKDDTLTNLQREKIAYDAIEVQEELINSSQAKSRGSSSSGSAATEVSEEKGGGKGSSSAAPRSDVHAGKLKKNHTRDDSPDSSSLRSNKRQKLFNTPPNRGHCPGSSSSSSSSSQSSNNPAGGRH